MEDLRNSDPRQIGGYRLIGRIGAGGMGVVYLAENSADLKVALKLVRPELVDDPGFRARFRREIEAAQRVGGICTARYLDADLESDHPYFVTEYVEGGNLFDYVAANGPIVGDQLVGLAVGLSEALVAMNAVGVIHRDLKPSNVLMAPSGPKVVDFGISHAADGTALTQTGSLIGSPGWMAPEQATGRENSAAIDVFSWGATVAFASTGKAPFGEGRPEAVLYRVVHEAPELEGLDPRLRELVGRALYKDPQSRPSVDQLLIDLVRTAMAGDMPSGGSIAMTTAVLDRTWQREPPEPLTADSKRHRRMGAIEIGAIVLVVGLVAAGVFLINHSDHKKTPAANSADKSHPITKSGLAASTTSTTSTTQTPSTTSTTGANSAASLVSTVLPLVVCPTTYGAPPQSTPVLPSTISESVPSNLASGLAVYTDQQGTMKLLAPTGWSCAANYGADGSGGVQVFPSGESDPNGEPFQASSAEGVVGTQSGGCQGCAVSQASPLFPAAASACESEFGGSAQSCQSQPADESTVQIESGVVGFLDPPGVAGDGNPSGGQYPANGVTTFHSGQFSDSYLDTCTLPSSEHDLCTTALDNFVQLYGNS